MRNCACSIEFTEPRRSSQTEGNSPRKRFRMRRAVAILGAAAAGALLLCSAAQAQQSQPAAFEDYKSFVEWMRATHRAPFGADPARLMSKQERAAFERGLIARQAANANKPDMKARVNVKVNQDRNPWPKEGIAQSVDPSGPANLVVISSDLREYVERSYYHVSTDHGRQFTDDAITAGGDDFLSGSPFDFNDHAVTSFDAAGNEFVVQISANSVFDPVFGYANDDAALQLVMGESHGLYLDTVPFDLDIQQCNGPGLLLPNNCSGFLQFPSIATDTNASSPTIGTTYATVTLFCEFMGDSNCPAIGNVDLTPGNSGIIGVSWNNFSQNGWQGTGLISGTHTNAQFSSVVVDSAGTPHVFFDDFTDPTTTTMWESTLTNGAWVVGAQPVASFVLTGTTNYNSSFTVTQSAAPGCAIFQMTAYCAFSANQITGGKAETTESVYLAKVNVNTGASTISRVNNDAFGDGKDHLFPWAATVPSGAVYVGWYDNRNDPNNVNVEYFVGKSTDGGSAFPVQMAVSDEPFDPCVGTQSCAFFSAVYSQLVAGPGGMVHAAWSDSRDGVSLQLWSQAITW
jgi:hypothetical protein